MTRREQTGQRSIKLIGEVKPHKGDESEPREHEKPGGKIRKGSYRIVRGDALLRIVR